MPTLNQLYKNKRLKKVKTNKTPALEKNPQNFTETEARPIWKCLISAISQLHSIDICHRDLKLQNILYNP